MTLTPNEDFLMSALARVIGHLPIEDDYLLIILKGHLLIEEQLVRVISRAFPYPEHLPERQTYALRLRLAKALRYDQAHPEIWSIAYKLNGFRNDYAHELSPPGIQAEIDKWGDGAERVLVDAGILEQSIAARDGPNCLRNIILAAYILLGRIDGVRGNMPAL